MLFFKKIYNLMPTEGSNVASLCFGPLAESVHCLGSDWPLQPGKQFHMCFGRC